MTRAEQLRADFNRTFYPDGRTLNKDARIFIEKATISIDGEVYEVPNLAVAPQTSVRDIVRANAERAGARLRAGQAGYVTAWARRCCPTGFP